MNVDLLKVRMILGDRPPGDTVTISAETLRLMVYEIERRRESSINHRLADHLTRRPYRGR